MYHCTCNLTGGCLLCNPALTLTPPIVKRAKIRITNKELKEYGVGWMCADKPPEEFIIEGILIK